MANGTDDWKARDHYNSWVVRIMSPITAIGLTVILGVGAYNFKAVSDTANLASKETKDNARDVAVLKEAVSTIKDEVKSLKGGQEKTLDKLDRLIEMQRSRP